MNIEEIISQTKLFFGKDRKILKEKILTFEFNGREYRRWINELKHLTDQPFYVGYGMFDDVVDWLKEKKYKEIDWHWLGDLSWEFKILLNGDVKKGFDWDKKLAINCEGTARIVRFYISDIVPCFVYDIYYMTYDKKEKYYEFGPLSDLTKNEKELIDKLKKFFKKSGFTLLSKNVAMQKYKELYSDTNSDGNASLFDALFYDIKNYQTEIKRFNDNFAKKLKDATGKEINWYEYCDKKGKLIKREEYRYFPSKDVECVITDGAGHITEIKVWRDIGKYAHREFKLDILKEFKSIKK